jgi:hypothetical protein
MTRVQNETPYLERPHYVDQGGWERVVKLVNITTYSAKAFLKGFDQT